jgi:hypothetical protein
MKNIIEETELGLSVCDYCDKVAIYESVVAVETRSYAILYFIGGDEIGLIKPNPKEREMVFYCEQHVPKVEPKKIQWVHGCEQCSGGN